MLPFMQAKFIYFCPGQTEISDKLLELSSIDPAVAGGIDMIELDGIDVTRHPFPRPLVVGGFEEIHAISAGFSLTFADAIIGGDWFITGRSCESYVKLRIAFAGSARFSTGAEGMAQPSESARTCSYIIQPGGAQISSSFDGGQEHHFCTISLSQDFLLGKLGLDEDDLPRALTQAWQQQKSAFGEYNISDRTCAAARELFSIKSEGSWRYFEIRSVAYDLLRLLLSDWREMKASETTRVSIRPEERAKLYAIMHMIADDPNKAGTLEQMSQDWGLNRNKLHFGFKHLFGRSISQFAMKQRIDHAKTLLRKGNLKIAEIAEEVGFSEPTNFTNSFKMHVGSTPLHYRKRVTAARHRLARFS